MTSYIPEALASITERRAAMTREWVRYQHRRDRPHNREPWGSLGIVLLSLIVALVVFS